MNKLFLTFILSIFLITLVSAESIGTFQPNQAMEITQYCSTGDCSYANLTSIQYPNGTIQNINSAMTKNGNNFNYSYTPTSLGTYTFNTCSNPTGVIVCDSDTFKVEGGELVFFVLALLLFGFLIWWGIRIQHPWVTLIGCFGLLILGIYTSLNGVGVYNNSVVNAITYITIAIGLGFGFQTVREIMDY